MASAAPLETGGEEVQAPRDYESEARQQGWIPPEEFKGDPSRLVDAKTFVERADEMMPLLKKRDRILKQENDTLKRDLRAMASRFEGMEKRAYERAVSDLERKHTEAVEMGDQAGAKQATDDLRALERETVSAKPAIASEQEVEEAVIEFRDKNPWYDKGGIERDYADLLAKKHAPEAKDMRPAEFFEMIGEKVRERFKGKMVANDSDDDADDDGKPRRRVLSPVEGGTTRRRSGGSRSYADLPPDAKRAADRFERQGVMKKEDYAKTYEWEK